ncbi:MAG: cbb3-type cytochrome oxidase assembly protein CcoS [Cellulophaga sp.]
MSVMYLLLAISIVVAIVFFVAFIFSVKNGQYDDSYTPSVRMLFDDELVEKAPKTSNSTKKTIQLNKSQKL